MREACPAQTSLVSRALDGFADAEIREQVVANLLRYLDTDTVWCVLLFRGLSRTERPSDHAHSFHETQPERLVELQESHWKPLIKWVEQTYDCKIELYEGLFGTRQPLETVLKLGKAVEGFDSFKLAGASRSFATQSSDRNADVVLEPQRSSAPCSLQSPT